MQSNRKVFLIILFFYNCKIDNYSKSDGNKQNDEKQNANLFSVFPLNSNQKSKLDRNIKNTDYLLYLFTAYRFACLSWLFPASTSL
jgi:hypothetical protein